MFRRKSFAGREKDSGSVMKKWTSSATCPQIPVLQVPMIFFLTCRINPDSGRISLDVKSAELLSAISSGWGRNPAKSTSGSGVVVEVSGSFRVVPGGCVAVVNAYFAGLRNQIWNFFIFWMRMRYRRGRMRHCRSRKRSGSGRKRRGRKCRWRMRRWRMRRAGTGHTNLNGSWTILAGTEWSIHDGSVIHPASDNPLHFASSARHRALHEKLT